MIIDIYVLHHRCRTGSRYGGGNRMRSQLTNGLRSDFVRGNDGRSAGTDLVPASVTNGRVIVRQRRPSFGLVSAQLTLIP